jgi:hypothetical protein
MRQCRPCADHVLDAAAGPAAGAESSQKSICAGTSGVSAATAAGASDGAAMLAFNDAAVASKSCFA